MVQTKAIVFPAKEYQRKRNTKGVNTNYGRDETNSNLSSISNVVIPL